MLDLSAGARRTIDLSGPVVYRDYGGDGLPPAVMVHGIGGAGINWMLLAPLLTGSFHVMALDLPGFGESPLAGRGAGLDAQRDLVARFVEATGEAPALVIGHSMGGLITMLLCASRPDLAHHAVLFDPAFPPTSSPAPGLPGRVLDVLSSAPPIAGRLGGLMVRARGGRTVVVQSFRETSVDGAALPAPFVEAHVAAEEARMRRAGAYVGYMQAWRWFRDNFRDQAGLEAMIQPNPVPTMLLHGNSDRVVLPEAARRLSQLHPSWQTHFMDGVGHNPNFEAPEVSARLILDWAAVAPSRPR